MSYKILIPSFLIALILQMSILGRLAILGVSVNLLLCLTVVFCLLYADISRAVICSLCAGILYDMCLSEYLGTFTIAVFLTIVACVVLKKFFNPENTFSMAILTVVANGIFYHLYWVIMLILGHSYNYYIVISHLPMYIIFNGIVMMAIYFVVVRKAVSHRQDRYFKW